MYYRKDAVIQNANGAALAGAQMYVCTQPANTSIIPPAPLAMTWSDPNGYYGLNGTPLVADGTGHVFYYAQPDFYTEVYYYRGVLQKVLPDQMVGCPGAAPPGDGGPVPYTFAIESSNVFGQPNPGQVVLLYTAFVQTIFPFNFASPASYGSAMTKPQSLAVYTVMQNGTTVGTVSISPQGVFTFSTSGFTLSPGDTFWVTAPNPADVTLSDVALSFVGTRTS